MKYEKVTIMIPTYNQARFIGKAVESALAQNYPELEVVVSDDKSTDETNKIIQGYLSDGRLKYFTNANRLGRAGNYRKTLYDHATGDWVLNLDGDDYLIDNSFIKDAMERIHDYEDVVLIGGGFAAHYPDRKTISFPTKKDIEFIKGTDLFFNWDKRSLQHFSSLYRRDIAKEIGFYRYDVMGSDWESILRILFHGNAILFRRIVGIWRVHGDNTSMDPDLHDVEKNIKAINGPYEYALEQRYHPGKLKRWKSKMLRKYFNGILWGIFYQKDFDLLRNYYHLLKRKSPNSLVIFFYPVNIIYILCMKSPVLLRVVRFINKNNQMDVAEKKHIEYEDG